MKIINILLSNKKGGVEDAFVAHCEILQKIATKQSGEILAIVKAGAPYAYNLKKIGINVIEVKNKFGHYDFLLQRKIQKIAKNFNSDIIFAHVGKAILIAKKIAKNLNITSIAVNHSNNVKRSIGCDFILCVNAEISKKAQILGQTENKILTIPNVIKFDKNEISKISYHKFDNKSEITIGAMGRFGPEKGFDFLIQAISLLRNEKTNIKLKLAGDGEEKQNLQKLTQKLNLENKIEFTGWVANKANFFNNIDIFCLTSNYETFGIVLLEAMKHKKPIIATNDIGPRSIIKHNENGLLISKDDQQLLPKNIATAITNLICDAKLSQKIVENGQKDLINKFSYDNLENILSKVILEIV